MSQPPKSRRVSSVEEVVPVNHDCVVWESVLVSSELRCLSEKNLAGANQCRAHQALRVGVGGFIVRRKLGELDGGAGDALAQYAVPDGRGVHVEAGKTGWCGSFQQVGLAEANNESLCVRIESKAELGGG